MTPQTLCDSSCLRGSLSRSLARIALSGMCVATAWLGIDAQGQTTSVTTDPVGYFTVKCQAASDTLVSVPFTRPPAFVGTIQSVSNDTVTISGTPGWTASQFVYVAGTQPNHYYALLGAGTSTANPKEGFTYAVTANTTTSLTLNLNGDSISTVPAGTQITIVPYWTLGTAFPAASAYPATNASFTPTTSTRAFNTQILIPDYMNLGTNPSFAATYFFSNNVNGSTNNVGWRIVGDNATSQDDAILLPDGFFVVRNTNTATELPFVSMGNVLTKKLTVPLATLTGAVQDNSVSLLRPVDVKLQDTGLSPTSGSFVATTSTRAFGDQLLVYDNSTAGFNKAPVATYFYSNNVNGSTNNVGWRIVGDNATPQDTALIPAGSALTIRKAGTADGKTVYWTNAPTY